MRDYFRIYVLRSVYMLWYERERIFASERIQMRIRSVRTTFASFRFFGSSKIEWKYRSFIGVDPYGTIKLYILVLHSSVSFVRFLKYKFFQLKTSIIDGVKTTIYCSTCVCVLTMKSPIGRKRERENLKWKRHWWMTTLYYKRLFKMRSSHKVLRNAFWNHSNTVTIFFSMSRK